MASEDDEGIESICDLLASSPSRRSITESVKFSETSGDFSDWKKLDRMVRMERPTEQKDLVVDGGGAWYHSDVRCAFVALLEFEWECESFR